MALNFNSGSGGAGGFSLGSVSTNAVYAKPKPKKPKQQAWWEKAIDTSGAILGGMLDTGYHLVKDPIAEVGTRGAYESTIDDIGMAIVDDYKHRYSSWDNFKSDPVAGVLDVLTGASAFFTFGGSLAARAAATGASAGKAARFAGLVESADLTTLGRAVGTSDPRFLKALSAEELDASAVLGRKGPIDSTLSGSKTRTIVRDDGTVLVPARGRLVGIDGTVLETVPLANSPLRRAMTNSGLKVSNSERFQRTGVIGSEARAGKLHNRLNRIKDETAVGATFGAGGANAVRRATKKLSPEEEAAQFARNTIGEAAEGPKGLAAMYSKRLDELEDALDMPAPRQKRIMDEAEIGAQVVSAATKGGKLNREEAKRAAMQQVEDLKEAAKTATSPQAQQAALSKAASAAKVAERVDAPDFEDFVANRVNLSAAMRDKDVVLPALRTRRDLLLSDQVEEVFRRPTKLMLRVEKAQKSASRYTTEFIKGDLNKNVREEMADGTLLARMALGRELTPEEAAALVVRPHSRPTGKKQTAREMRSQYAKRPSAPKTKPGTVPEFSKYSRGYNFQYALDSMSPAAVFKVWNESRAYKAKTQVLKRAAKSGIRIETEEQRKLFKSHPDFELVGGDNPTLKKAALLRDKLDNEVRLIVGDSVAREEASNVIGELLARHVDKAAEYAMPKVYFKHLTQEINRADNFVTRLVDTPTAIFRAAVLNLRPAWMVNNFVGQMMLVLFSQGVLHGSREYMMEVGRAAKAGRLAAGRVTLKEGSATDIGRVLDERAGALSMGAGTSARELAEAGIAAEKGVGLRRLVENPGIRLQRSVEKGGTKASLAAHTANVLTAPFWATKNLADFMGNVNQILTDDIPRRAAFMGAVRPMLQKVQKANPDLSTEDALRLILTDDDATARLVDRTMGDLIDFSRMNTAEREVVRRLLPFYSWMKGITLRTGRIIRDEPQKALAAYQLGKQYAAGSDERWGGVVPDNLKGALRIGTDSEGRPRIATLNGMNIFQTPADIAGIAGNLLGKGEVRLGGTHPFSSLSPILKAPIEVAMGRDLFFGGPLYSSPEKGLMNTGLLDKPWTPEDESRSKPAAMASRYLASLGPMALYQRTINAGPFSADEQRLLVRDKKDAALAYLGRPGATLNVEKATKLANGNVQYGLVRYDPSLGEEPGVFGRAQRPSAPAQTGLNF